MDGLGGGHGMTREGRWKKILSQASKGGMERPPVFASLRVLVLHNRTEAPRGLTSDLALNDTGHLNTLHTSIAKFGYFTDIRWSH